MGKEIKSVVFFAYGGKTMGMGHMVRIEGLARAFIKKRPGLKITFVVPAYAEGFDYIKAKMPRGSTLIKISKRFAQNKTLPSSFPECDVAIFDCLRNSPEKLREAKKRARLLVTFDDNGAGARESDLAFNPLYYCTHRKKRTERIFQDPSYMPLRDRFAKGQARYPLHRGVMKKKKILILQGGADAWNGLVRIVKKLNIIRKDIVAVPVAGTSYIHEKEMKKIIKNIKIKVEFHRAVRDIDRLMLKADAAISGCGLSIFELMCLGVPSLTVTDEPKELETARNLEALGCVVNLGRLSRLTNKKFEKALNNVLDNKVLRRRLFNRSTKAIDGRGAEKVFHKIARVYAQEARDYGIKR